MDLNQNIQHIALCDNPRVSHSKFISINLLVLFSLLNDHQFRGSNVIHRSQFLIFVADRFRLQEAVDENIGANVDAIRSLSHIFVVLYQDLMQSSLVDLLFSVQYHSMRGENVSI